MHSVQFARRVGFGLTVDEQEPADPVAWAADQLAGVAPLYFKGELPATEAAVDARASYMAARKALRTTLANQPKQLADRMLDLNRKTRFPVGGWEYHARGYAAAYGPTPVFERLWHFWTNHFTVSSIGNDLQFLIGCYNREAIRPMMARRFSDLLFAATTHTAMLEYLDNARSIGPNSEYAKTVRTRPKAAARGLNENHARELLELHSMSSGAGYTQNDVVELALIMTGWYEGRFVRERHEPGPRTFLGKVYRDRGADTLREAIEDISAMPQTARFISHKLATAFVADDPPQAATDHIAGAWKAGNGRLPDVHRALFEAVHRWGADHAKFLPPEAWFIQCARIFGAAIFVQPGETFLGGENQWAIISWYRELGQNLFFAEQPDGWSDAKSEWVSPEMIDRRIRFGAVFAAALRQAGRLRRGVISEAVRKNCPGAGPQIAALLAGANGPADSFQRICASPFLMRC